MITYNQRDYAQIPYPAPGYEKATVKTAGCGPVCFAMLIANLLRKTYTVEEAVKFAQESGARVSGGTDMSVLAKAAEKAFPLKFRKVSTVDEMTSAVKYQNAMCIANVGKNGLFSEGGHYVLVHSVGPVYLTVLDPMLYDGKFDKAGRRGKIVRIGDVCYVDADDLDDDTKGYYLFERVETMTTSEAIKILAEKGILNTPAYWGNAVQVVKYLDELFIKIAEAMK